MAKAGVIDAADMTRSSSEIKSAIVGAGLQCGQWGERIMANNMDAIGFANSAVQSQAARAQLCDEEDLALWGLEVQHILKMVTMCFTHIWSLTL